MQEAGSGGNQTENTAKLDSNGVNYSVKDCYIQAQKTPGSSSGPIQAKLMNGGSQLMLMNTPLSMKTKGDSIMSSTCTGSKMSLNSGAFSDGKQDYTAIMKERWLRANILIPEMDQKDIIEESPIINPAKNNMPKHQHHPEFSQSSYLRLRSLEEAFAMKNYLDPKNSEEQKLSFAQRITNKIQKKLSSN